ncbi:MAG TPA: phosphate butyryltransferase [Bacteroidales bacterium]|nr:MAG: phosphate butyryltransferase [Bacteroidetes bacterium GWF2_33_38]OFY90984.1 MAG: phosphate butyryltransferase [Bacteroidetes bacterium RIFOXYA2_FULL_33_7]HBF89200.1 phosphate butyryltransferase [Bacteroidales bacterium]
MELNSLQQFVEIAKNKTKRRIAVAAAADEPVLEAVNNAMKLGIIDPILVGEKSKIEEICKKINFNLAGIQIIDESDPYKASVKAVSIIREGNAEILMKGLVATGPMLKAVLDKENGLRTGAALSHVAFFESPYYHKLIAVTDAAMNVAPEFEEKVDMLKNAVNVFHKLGLKNPKVAVVGAVESVNPKMEATVHAAMMTMMNKRGQIKGCIVDGPLALDNAVSKEAAEHKGIVSEVAGDADLILTPDINAGNVLYKSLNFLGGATVAAVIMGAKVPIVLTSRADSDKSKMLSIALAAAMD